MSIAKMIAFSLLYGMGLDELAYRLGVSRGEAQKVRRPYLDLWPGLKEMQRAIKDRAQAGEPIRTWGGREYYCEPSRVINGRLRSFDYKLLNYQSKAALRTAPRRPWRASTRPSWTADSC